jgi:hypothetical protein
LPSSVTEIDRKLHLIVRHAEPAQYSTATALGRAIAGENCTEFSYQRGGRTEFASSDTVASYALYAREIGLLTDDFQSARPKSDIRSLGNFQQWLSDVSFAYLQSHGASIEQIAASVRELISSEPCELPTVDNLFRHLNPSLSKYHLRLSLKVVSLLRPLILGMKSRRLVIVPSVITL